MQQKQPVRFTHRERMAILEWIVLQVVAAHSACFLPFMRHTFGPRFFHPHGFTALILLQPIAAASIAGRIYLWVWLITLFGHRIHTFRIWLLGKQRLPSAFSGVRYLAHKLPMGNSRVDAVVKEPFICLFAGLLLATISPSLGLFVMAGFVSMSVNVAMAWWIIRRERQAMVDEECEMMVMADIYRRR